MRRLLYGAIFCPPVGGVEQLSQKHLPGRACRRVAPVLDATHRGGVEDAPALRR